MCGGGKGGGPSPLGGNMFKDFVLVLPFVGNKTQAPDMPGVPAPPAPPPVDPDSSPEAKEAKARARRAALAAQGRSSTLLTGGEGLTLPAETQKKTLLGQ